MAEPRKMLTIDTLRRRVVDQITIDGTKHDVLAMRFETHEMLKKADEDDIEVARKAVKDVCPSLGDDVIGRFELEHAQQIVALANSNVDAVEKMFPNAVRPEKTSTSPG